MRQFFPLLMSDSFDPDDEQDETVPVAVLIAPNGMRVQTLDFFLDPKEIIVGKTAISFDGWIFRLDEGLTKSNLAWFIQQTLHLTESMGEDRAMAILDGIEKTITRFSQQASADSARAEQPFTGHLPRK